MKVTRFGRARSDDGWRRPWTRAVSTLAVLALALAACGGGDDGAEEDDAGDDGEAAAPGDGASGGSGEADLIVWFARDYHIPPDAFESFEDEYPDINVTYDVRPGDDILPTLLQMRDAGERMPDLIQDDSAVIPGYVQADLLLPMDDLVARWEEEDPENFENLHPSVFEQGTFDGQIYHAALLANFDLMYYDVEWFDEAGAEPEFETWEDVLETARVLKEARPDMYPFTIQADPRDGVTALLNMFITSGTPFDGAVPDLTSEGGLYITEMLQTMVDEEIINPEAIAWGEDEARGSFIGRRAALIIEGLNTAADFTDTPDYNYEEDWATTLLPDGIYDGGPDGDYYVVPRGFSIVGETEYPYETSLALRYLAETEQQVGTVLVGAAPPRSFAALEDSPELDEYLPFFTPDIREAFLEGVPNPPSTRFGEIEAVLGEWLNTLVAGDADDDLEAYNAQYQEELDELIE